MTVKELIAKLENYDGDADVAVFNKSLYEIATEDFPAEPFKIKKVTAGVNCLGDDNIIAILA